MKKFVAAPTAESLGIGMQSYFENENKDEVQPLVESVLMQHGITQIDPEKWYPVQISLDVFKTLEENPGGKTGLVAIGVAIMDTLPFPPEIQTIPDAIKGLGMVYSQSIRNFFEGEGYLIEEETNNSIRFVDNTPWPHDLLYGYFYSVARRFAPSGRRATVYRTYLNEASPNEDGAVYEIKW